MGKQEIRQIASDCERQLYSQQPRFHFHVSSISFDELQNTHFEIAQELFSDGIISWTRIITLVVFSAMITERLIEGKQQQQQANLMITSMIDWTTNFINTNLRSWLETQNYWDGCLKMYKIPRKRNPVSRFASIFGTIGMITLGAFYINKYTC
ncbi:hypothetical protein I4U23_024345 [Adineta vaga]|nr:hypothetical protein I4U23_024345 [Adineta vaga]